MCWVLDERGEEDEPEIVEGTDVGRQKGMGEQGVDDIGCEYPLEWQFVSPSRNRLPPLGF